MRSLRFAASAVLVVLTASLASCAAVAPASAPASSKVTAETIDTTTPLTCADLLSPDAAVLALTGTDGVTPALVEAVQPSYAVEHALLTGAGGLACSWRAGTGQVGISDEQGDWAYLSVEVLPDAAADWVAPYAGDVPSEEHRTVGQVDAVTSAGESGWRISAPVGTAWVDMRVTSSGLISGGSRFEGASFDGVLDAMMPAAETTFATITAATADQVGWPKGQFREGEARCDGGLDQVGIENALQLDGASVKYTLVDSRAKTIDGLADAVEARIGVFRCELFAEGFGNTEITVIRGFDPFIEELATMPDISSALEPIVLDGAVAGETALQARREDGPRSPVYFTLGQTLFGVASDGAATVAEAIIAQTR
ncbi:hypothetical protein B7495_03900 [Cryobacterium sp. LW097]|uniref:hypothetical protein n=1 Tax=Cryobacterium sp. LW097 TaxID=1978566 RepID=UPI000B4C7572|nr:hypothetical protein [Cryobacterium sp. LW097]ASD21342.1 hypothetical protein B7495_03900 [Cryobacterium sp. LW097]